MISLTSPVKTAAHSWPAGLKMAGLCLATLALFQLTSAAIQAIVFLSVLALYALPGRVFLFAGLRHLRILWPFILIVGLWHFITDEFHAGLTIILRMLNAFGLAMLVTMTTRLSDMIDVVRWITTPFRRFGLPTRALEVAIAMVIRFTPVLLEKGRTLAESYAARSGKRANWRIVMPFAVVALDDADHVAEALRARGGIQEQKD